MPRAPERHTPPTQGKDAIHKVEARQYTSRTYGADWRRLRKLHLDRHPLCVQCGSEGVIREATDVDHVTPIKLAPHRRLDPSNLQSLCHSHHSQKTARENGGRHF